MLKHNRIGVATRSDGMKLIAQEWRGNKHRKYGRSCHSCNKPDALRWFDCRNKEWRSNQSRQCESEATDKCRAFETGHDDESNRQPQQQAALLRVARDKQHRRHGAGRGHQMLWGPRGLKEPSGESGRLRHKGLKTFTPKQPS